MRRKARGAFVILLLATPLVTAGCLSALDARGNPPPAPAFTVKDTNGTFHNLSDYEGRVLVLDFMATTCVPCKEEVEEFRQVRDSFPEDQVALLSISVDPSDTNQDLHEFQSDHAGLWPYARDTDDAKGKYKVILIPKLVIVDPEQRIVHTKEGAVTAEEIADVVRRHLPEGEA